MITLFKKDGHSNVMFHDLCAGAAVQANQHVIVDNGEAMLLDPGGHKVYTKLFAELSGVVSPSGLKYLFFSHQDPDIVAAANGWLMVTDAQAYVSGLWTRFIPHFGIDELATKRLNPIGDRGGAITVGGARIKFVPGHFLHSPGNFQVYDPVSKILYSGDLGASIDTGYMMVEDFEKHVPFMEGFHRRYMASPLAFKLWAKMVRKLDIEIIAPQHGAVFGTRELSAKFIDWIESLPCGPELMEDAFQIPE